jgi:uncharacterized membrane protein HdeD (DUF308 family)
MLTDPRKALAEQSNFIGYLLGLAGVARVVHALAADGNRRADPPREADGFVYVLLAFASLGGKIESLAESTQAQSSATAAAAPRPSTETRWLR